MSSFLITYFSGTLNRKQESSVAVSQKVEGVHLNLHAFHFIILSLSITVLKVKLMQLMLTYQNQPLV